jgi:hypothetical protein
MPVGFIVVIQPQGLAGCGSYAAKQRTSYHGLAISRSENSKELGTRFDLFRDNSNRNNSFNDQRPMKDIGRRMVMR